jgi:hypothetical protein
MVSSRSRQTGTVRRMRFRYRAELVEQVAAHSHSAMSATPATISAPASRLRPNRRSLNSKAP